MPSNLPSALRMTFMFILTAGIVVTVPAQNANLPSNPITLEDAIHYALAHYPAVRASVERLNAAKANVGLAKTNYLPSASMLWQGNRATRNNIFGPLLPQSVIPGISGPVLPFADNTSVWGNGAGLLLSWEPFDFGYRHALVSVARAGQSVAGADAQLTRLEVAVAVVSAFFDVAAAQQTSQAARADVDRRQTIFNTVHVLVQNELRPGAEESRANAELAASRVRLIQAQTNERLGRAALADLLGVPVASFDVDAGAVLRPPPEDPIPAAVITANPAAAIENFRTQAAQAQVRVLDRSYYPHFNFQSAVSGRGTGANVDGTVQGGSSGLGIDRSNWATGLTITFPALDIFSIRARKRIAEAGERAQAARYDQVVQDLSAEAEKARAAADGARQIAQNTPDELRAATDTEKQARARYQAGLTSIVELSEAESLLVQAEIDDALARLNAWRALAGLAAAEGDLQPFLQAIHTGGP